MYTTKIDYKFVVDEKEHIIVTQETEDLAPFVRKTPVHLHTEMVVMLVSIVTPTSAIQREEGAVIITKHTSVAGVGVRKIDTDRDVLCEVALLEPGVKGFLAVYRPVET